MSEIDVKELDLGKKKFISYNLKTRELENVFANSKKIDSGVELGMKSIENYIMENSTLKKNQFVIAQLGGSGYSHFYVSKGNEILDLGGFSYDRFVRAEYGKDMESRYALKQFLDLCIKKIDNPKIEVPMLGGNPSFWDMEYIYTEGYDN